MRVCCSAHTTKGKHTLRTHASCFSLLAFLQQLLGHTKKFVEMTMRLDEKGIDVALSSSVSRMVCKYLDLHTPHFEKTMTDAMMQSERLVSHEDTMDYVS